MVKNRVDFFPSSVFLAASKSLTRFTFYALIKFCAMFSSQFIAALCANLIIIIIIVIIIIIIIIIIKQPCIQMRK
jgi:hypothetical protein